MLDQVLKKLPSIPAGFMVKLVSQPVWAADVADTFVDSLFDDATLRIERTRFG